MNTSKSVKKICFSGYPKISRNINKFIIFCSYKLHILHSKQSMKHLIIEGSIDLKVDKTYK